MKNFTAKIIRLGINPCVVVPENVLKELFRQSGKTKGPIPVRGKLNGTEFIQTLVKYKGAWRLYLNTPMRRNAGIDVGDTARVKIEVDKVPRIIGMHPKLKNQLQKKRKAKSAFESLSPSRQKEIIRYINYLKTEESVERNVLKVMEYLSGKGSFAGRDKI